MQESKKGVKGQKAQVVVMAIPEIENDEIFVLLLKTNKERGGFWQNVTGTVNDGEEIRRGASRELWEETAITQEEMELVDLNFKFSFTSKFKTEVEETTILAILNQCGEITIDPQEHDDFLWVRVADITSRTYKFRSNFLVFEKALEYLLDRKEKERRLL